MSLGFGMDEERHAQAVPLHEYEYRCGSAHLYGYPAVLCAELTLYDETNTIELFPANIDKLHRERFTAVVYIYDGCWYTATKRYASVNRGTMQQNTTNSSKYHTAGRVISLVFIQDCRGSRTCASLEGDLSKSLLEHLALDGRNLELKRSRLAAAVGAGESTSAPSRS